jgi:hypothetical protein
MAKPISMEKSPEEKLTELEERLAELKGNFEAANKLIGENFKAVGGRLQKLERGNQE